MKIQEILNTTDRVLSRDQVRLVQNSCEQFLSSTANPLLKSIPGKDQDFLKVKVRFHKRRDNFIDLFNEALFHKYHSVNIHQRSIFANGQSSFVVSETDDPYYIFPIDGFKFLYSKQVQNSNYQFKDTFETLLKEFAHDSERVAAIVKDLMIYTYTAEDLDRGIVEGCEIVVYNIPYYFAINARAIPNYQQLLATLRR